jgi:non-specific serine/threonine protein kinase
MALGLVMHHGLIGVPALDEPDVSKLMQRLAPQGQEFVRLPWSVPRPVPDPLRAIVNRATDRQPRQRYRNARTLQRALEGWLKTVASLVNGPLVLLMDRFQSVGVLPSQPGGAERVALLALMDRSRTSELAELALSDVALTFDLLRLANAAQVHGVKVSADAPVLMLRRAVAMLGLDGVRRAALSLRPWPGPMSADAAREMAGLIHNAHRAARIAVRLVSAGYDGEVVYLTALMQNLGWLLVYYHFPEEAAQIRRLMLPSEAPAEKKPGPANPDSAKPSEKSEEPGMTAEAASFAVLGVDVEEIGLGVAKHWGLDEDVQLIMRRWPLTSTVHPPASDMDVLRTTASCANEMVDALSLPATRVQAALRLVFQRYGRPLSLTIRDIQDALQLETHASDPASQPSAPLPAKKASTVPTGNTPKPGQRA